MDDARADLSADVILEANFYAGLMRADAALIDTAKRLAVAQQLLKLMEADGALPAE